MTSSVTGVDRGVLKRSDDAILKSAVDADMPVAGVVAMVTDRNGNIYEGAAGKRRIDGDAAITTNDVFALFSTTKAITASHKAIRPPVDDAKIPSAPDWSALPASPNASLSTMYAISRCSKPLTTCPPRASASNQPESVASWTACLPVCVGMVIAARQ